MFKLRDDNLLPMSFYVYWIKNILIISIIVTYICLYVIKKRLYILYKLSSLIYIVTHDICNFS